MHFLKMFTRTLKASINRGSIERRKVAARCFDDRDQPGSLVISSDGAVPRSQRNSTRIWFVQWNKKIYSFPSALPLVPQISPGDTGLFLPFYARSLGESNLTPSPVQTLDTLPHIQRGCDCWQPGNRGLYPVSVFTCTGDLLTRDCLINVERRASGLALGTLGGSIRIVSKRCRRT